MRKGYHIEYCMLKYSNTIHCFQAENTYGTFPSCFYLLSCCFYEILINSGDFEASYFHFLQNMDFKCL